MILPHYFLNEKGDKIFSPLEASEIIPATTSSLNLALIDRDGVIVAKATRHQYILRPEDAVLLPYVGEAIHILNEEGIPAIIVTNQPGIHKQLMSPTELVSIDAKIQNDLGRYRAHLDAVIYCPHPAQKEGDVCSVDKLCNCRKPKPGMIQLALKMYGPFQNQAVMFGDFESDVQAAKNAGVVPVYIATIHDEFEVIQ